MTLNCVRKCDDMFESLQAPGEELSYGDVGECTSVSLLVVHL